MWKRRLILILALVAVVGLVAARPDASRDLGRRGWEKVKALLFRIRPRPKEIKLPDIVPVVRIKQIGSAKFVRMRQYYGEIKPNREARLLFEVPGRIASRFIAIGPCSSRKDSAWNCGIVKPCASRQWLITLASLNCIFRNASCILAADSSRVVGIRRNVVSISNNSMQKINGCLLCFPA